MALLKYYKPSNPGHDSYLPNPSGPLSSRVNPASIKAADEAVRSLNPGNKTRGTYSKYTPEQQAEIGEYASINGNQAIVRHFAKKQGIELKVTSVQTWKDKYRAELSRKRKAGEEGALSVKSLPVKKRGRPLLLGDNLDNQVQSYIGSVCQGGGVITTSITMAAATAIVRKSDRNLLAMNGGPITITTNWAKSLLNRMNFVKRRGSSTMKMTVADFESVKEQFISDVKTVVEMEDLSPDLIFNWDHTGINIVPGSSWTLEAKGSKRVEITGLSDKRQITAVFCGTLTGDFLPPQLIYQGKTQACLPRYQFPKDWHVTCTPNHWSNEDKVKEYIEFIIVPYITKKRQQLKVSATHSALAIFDVFKGQQTEKIRKLLEDNNILVVDIPGNCTDRLQPMDLSINKSVKEFMREKFRDRYSTQVQDQLEGKADSISPVDLKMSTLKPPGACWLVSLYDYILTDNKSIVENGFKAAGLLF